MYLIFNERSHKGGDEIHEKAIFEFSVYAIMLTLTLQKRWNFNSNIMSERMHKYLQHYDNRDPQTQ